MFSDTLLASIRDRFAGVETCPVQGPRIFFENAGGALTLKSVVETSAQYAAMPDNLGRDNPASQALREMIAKACADMSVFMNARDGLFFVGESGTELLFRLVMNACLATGPHGVVLGSTLEHPASRSACHRWSTVGKLDYKLIAHDNLTGVVSPQAYGEAVTSDTKVASIVHTSPVTGMGVDVKGCVEAIRNVAPDCYIVVDGIQHAAHGDIDIESYQIDGYVISPYKVFSRHGYGLAWISDRMRQLPHDTIVGAPTEPWELGTRDAGSYATLSDLVEYFDWLGGEVSDSVGRRQRIEAASAAIKAHEKTLTDAMIYGSGNLPGLKDLPGVEIIGGAESSIREGLVSFVVDGISSKQIVADLNAAGVRTHTRMADHYSGNILEPLGLEACVRVSLCHYNSLPEVSRFLALMKGITDRA
ncbi:MAG: aminotransferase class V-fold PLP-dependent enzyme [Pseudomonadota bacterium]